MAYAVWHMTPLHDEPMGDGRPPPSAGECPRRLRVFADACGLDAVGRGRLVYEVARGTGDPGRAGGLGALAADPAAERHWNGGRFTVPVAVSLTWLDRHRDALEEALR